MTDAQKIAALRNNLGNLDEKGREFAESLLGYWDRRGSLSAKQWYWVGKLAGLTTEKKKDKKKKEAPKPDARVEDMLRAQQPTTGSASGCCVPSTLTCGAGLRGQRNCSRRLTSSPLTG